MVPLWVVAYFEVRMVMLDSISEEYAMSLYEILIKECRCGLKGGR